jgi:hypothetical protein
MSLTELYADIHGKLDTLLADHKELDKQNFVEIVKAWVETNSDAWWAERPLELNQRPDGRHPLEDGSVEVWKNGSLVAVIEPEIRKPDGIHTGENGKAEVWESGRKSVLKDRGIDKTPLSRL